MKKDGFTKREFDSDFWGNVVSLGGDVLGAIPGVGAVGLGARGAVNALRTREEAVTLDDPDTLHAWRRARRRAIMSTTFWVLSLPGFFVLETILWESFLDGSLPVYVMAVSTLVLVIGIAVSDSRRVQLKRMRGRFEARELRDVVEDRAVFDASFHRGGAQGENRHALAVQVGKATVKPRMRSAGRARTAPSHSPFTHWRNTTLLIASGCRAELLADSVNRATGGTIDQPPGGFTTWGTKRLVPPLMIRTPCARGSVRDGGPRPH